jgi:hypothetical protein
MHRGFEKTAKMFLTAAGIVLCLAGALVLSCQKSGTNPPPAKNPALSDLTVTLPGWVVPADTGTQWIGPDSMFNYVDGGDWNYIEDSVKINGVEVTTLDSGLYQAFSRSNPLDSDYAQLYVLDYRTPANAAKVFNRIIATYAISPDRTIIGGFDTTVAVGGAIGTSLWSFAHFGKYYVETRIFKSAGVTRLTDDSLVATTNACFTQVRSKIE